MLKIFDIIIFQPIMLLIQVLLSFIMQNFAFTFLALFIFSLIINLLVLPLYFRAKFYQDKLNQIEKTINDKVKFIKTNFSGNENERKLLIRTLYKQNNYNISLVLKSSLPFILEIIIFISSYRVLSLGIDEISKSSIAKFLIINFNIPNIVFNSNQIRISLIPIFATIVSIVSIVIYNRNSSLKKLILPCLIYLLFLITLFNSSLMFCVFWLYNSLFSLARSILFLFYKKKDNNCSIIANDLISTNTFISFIIINIFNIVLFTLYIPLGFIFSSPKEFISTYPDFNLVYIFVRLILYGVSIFFILGSIIYFMLDNKSKEIYVKIISFLSLVFLVNYCFFSLTDPLFTVEFIVVRFNYWPIIIRIIHIVILISLFIMIFKKINFKFLNIIFIVLIIISFSVIVRNVCLININVFGGTNSIVDNKDRFKRYKLSTNGKNVILIALDGADGKFLPYIFNEKSELKELYSGFKYYPNTISFAPFTNAGLPPIFGGYEYTPIEINKKKDKSLIDKRKEAYSIIPSIFKSHGYNTTTYDAFYQMDGINSNIIRNAESVDFNVFINRFFMLSITAACYDYFQPLLYDGGFYHCSNDIQKPITAFEAIGKPRGFMRLYNDLEALSSTCDVVSNSENNYICMFSGITHTPGTLLQTPDYSIKEYVNNKDYYLANKEKFKFNGKYLFNFEDMVGVRIDDPRDSYLYPYSSNMGTIVCIGKFIKYLKDNNVYDNTRIIIVSDHPLPFTDEPTKLYENVPFLLVKDFNSVEFSEETTFMTNADVPTLIFKDLVDNPKNPYTNRIINNSDKTDHKQIIYLGPIFHITNEDYILKKSKWASIFDNNYDINNWEYTKGKYVLDEHELPKDDAHKITDG